LAQHSYIAIEGVIGVGKTTLVRLLSPDLQATPVLEVFDENPFLSSFYSDRARYAFQTQIFFLLSRYRQQHNIPEALARGPVVSDYTFAKDSLFAHLNLGGDELAVYDRLHGALAEKIPKPDLFVYLRADLDVLMARIAQRDRTYERQMERDYIESLRLAYEGFIAAYSQSPVLVIDTNNLDFVRDPAALASIRERVMSMLEQGAYQQMMPQFAPTLSEAERAALATLASGSRKLGDLQRWQGARDRAQGQPADWLPGFLGLTQSLGTLGAALAESDSGDNGVQPALVACLEQLMQLANATDVDLEEAYVARKLNPKGLA
jgi:deoxyguanosine kinase